jgi:peptidyl-prolyl cis-trans isomerase SurA
MLFTVYCSSTVAAVLFDRVVAAVNNEIITWSELRNTIENEGREFLRGLDAEEREKKINEIQKQFLERMIDVKLQLQEARKMGLHISLSETEKAIADIKKKYNLTDEELIGSLKAEGLALEDYRRQLAEQILLSKIVRYKVNDNILISDEEIERYYQVNKGQYRGNETVRIRQIFFTMPEDEGELTTVEAKAREVLKRVKRGEDFAKIAREVSEDASRDFGGDLGYINRGTVIREIDDVAFDLNPGEVSEPFWSQSGLHIIKLEDRKAGSTIEEVRKDIQEILFKEAFAVKYEEWIKTLREKAYIEVNL